MIEVIVAIIGLGVGDYADPLELNVEDKDKPMNQKEVTLQLNKVTLKKVDYAYNVAVLTTENEDDNGVIKTAIYTMDSVKAGNPIPVGTLFFKNFSKYK